MLMERLRQGGLDQKHTQGDCLSHGSSVMVAELDSTTARASGVCPKFESWKDGHIVLMNRLRLRAVLLIYYLKVYFQSSSRRVLHCLTALGDAVKGGICAGQVRDTEEGCPGK